MSDLDELIETEKEIEIGGEFSALVLRAEDELARLRAERDNIQLAFDSLFEFYSAVANLTIGEDNWTGIGAATDNAIIKRYIDLQAERDALKTNTEQMAALLDITLNAGIEPSRLELVQIRAERDALREVCKKLDEYQRIYQKSPSDDKFPGNEYYSDLGFCIVEEARAALDKVK